MVGHAYAVLNYDEAKDLITLWNPHGNNFKPMGPEGFINGYETKGGVFTLSSKDFPFSSIIYLLKPTSPLATKNKEVVTRFILRASLRINLFARSILDLHYPK